MEFTLLMAVYAGDDEAFVRAAYRSATRDQTLPPTHVVVVQDGPVGDGIARWLDEIARSPAVTVVRLAANQGLAAALNAGLAAVTTEIVARADADDICLPERFARQIPLVEAGYDLVGSAIDEFTDDPAHPGAIRPVMTTPAEIAAQARLESPFHHPTVVFRKSAVLRAGGYPQLKQMEDYLLWARMLVGGARVTNVADVLVHYRVGAGAFHRRGGPTLARSEASLQKEFRALGFTTRRQFLRNRLLRGPLYRHLPGSVRRLAYHLWGHAKRFTPRTATTDAR
ncbi:MAG: glycosyltransferase [Propionibacteriaceae bacterium]|jgi:glycosyltransferase involved in cell wall biosynthesis|nr:glycosyltransferase [Propionibacteriaceae bacterium]